jgi:transposase-like protein
MSGKACDPAVYQQIIPLMLNGASVPGTVRILGIHPNTVCATIKKSTRMVRVNPVYLGKDLSLGLKMDKS